MDQRFIQLIRIRIIDRLLTENEKILFSGIVSACKAVLPDDECEARMIREDLDRMKKPDPEGYNAPVSYEGEKDEYFYSDESFSLSRIPLKAEEERFFDLSLQYLYQLSGRPDIKSLKSYIQKIMNIRKIQNIQGEKKTDFVQPEVNVSYGGNQFLVPLINCIQKRKVIRIYYHPFYEDKPYFSIVHPYLLKEYRNRWYLIGLNDIKKEVRTYALDRIWEVQEINQEYIPQKFRAADYFRNTVGIIAPLGEPPEIRISVLRHQAQYLITQPLHDSQYIESEDEEKVIFVYKVHPTYEFKSMILAMGSDVKVISPDSFKKEILRELNNAILSYGK